MASEVEVGGTRYILLPGTRKKELWQYFGFKSEDGKTIAPGSEKKVYCQVCKNLPFLCLNSRPICAQKLAAVLTF